MLHAYFRPNGEVLFAVFDPELSCELPDTSTVQAFGDPTAPAGLPILPLAAGLIAGLGWLFFRRSRSSAGA
jgi:hypothetical protein